MDKIVDRCLGEIHRERERYREVRIEYAKEMEELKMFGILRGVKGVEFSFYLLSLVSPPPSTPPFLLY